MIYYSIAQLLNVFTILVVGLFVYLKNRRRLINKRFASHSLAIAVWAFSFAKMATSQNEAAGLFWSRALHVGAIFIPIFLLHFICALLDIVQEKRKIIITAYIIGLTMLAFVPTNLFVSHTVAVAGFQYFVGPAGFQYHFFPLFFVVCSVYALYLLFKGIKNSEGLQKNQRKYLFIALLIGYSGGPTGFLPLYRIPIPWWGLLTVSISIGMIAYTIVKYRLMDINIVIKRGASYAFLALFTTSISIGLVLGVNQIFASLPGYNPMLATVIILLIVIPLFTYLLPRVKLKTESTVEKILYKDKYAYFDTLRSFSQQMTFILDQGELLQSAVRNVVVLMGLEGASIFIANGVTGKLELRARAGGRLPDDTTLQEDSAIINNLKKNKKSILKEEIEKVLPPKEMANIEVDFIQIKASLVVPLVVEDELIGIFALGEKASKEMFSHLDIELLKTLANQIALILDYKRMEEQLQQQDKLIGLATMAAGIGHEIGNAIVSVHTFLQLFPKRRLDNEFYEQFGKTALNDAQRIAQLVDMMRKLAQPRSGMAEFEPLDIRMVIEEAVGLLQKAFTKENIRIITRYDKVPEVKGDKPLLQMAFLNLFRNSLDFLSSGGEIAVSLSNQEKVRLGPKSKPQQCVRLEISDNGPGIEKEQQSRIFEPFFTTRIKGTGLGLPLVHRVIEEHGGNIALHSKIGEGTTFTINLPIKR